MISPNDPEFADKILEEANKKDFVPQLDPEDMFKAFFILLSCQKGDMRIPREALVQLRPAEAKVEHSYDRKTDSFIFHVPRQRRGLLLPGRHIIQP